MLDIQFTPEQIDGFEVNRCYRGKVQTYNNDELRQALWLTHSLFNEKVSEVCRAIFKVLNNKDNPEFAELTRWAIQNISPAGQCSTHFANPFTLPDSRANPTHSAYKKDQTGERMAELFHLCKERGDRWYVRKAIFGSLVEMGAGGSGMVAEVNQAAIEKISGYLALMENWRNGKTIPFRQMEEEAFVKKLAKFIKENKDLLTAEWQNTIDEGSIEKDTELYEILLNGERKKQESLLKDIFRFQLQYGWLLDEVEQLYQQYSNEAIGKTGWLKQKKTFDEQNSEFLKQYKELLNNYRNIFYNQKETKPSDTLPNRWFRDPNFLKLLHEKGLESWSGFMSPKNDEQFKTEWNHIRSQGDYPEEAWDDREGREIYIQALKRLNPALFKPSGWFKLFEHYRTLQRFARPPQFRYPDPINHPDWVNFSEGGCFKYRNPQIVSNAVLAITVKLIDPAQPTRWKDYTLQVSLDQRLKTLQKRQNIHVPDGRWMKSSRTVLKNEIKEAGYQHWLDERGIEQWAYYDESKDGQGWSEKLFDWKPDENGNAIYKSEPYYRWMDTDGEIRWIQIHGGNLIYRSKTEARTISDYKPKDAFYLHFRYTYKAVKKPRIRMLQESGEYRYQAGTRLLALDQGQKADAVIAMMEVNKDGKLQPVRFEPFYFKKKKGIKTPSKKVMYQWITLPGGASFRAISHAERIRSLKRKAVQKKNFLFDQKLEEKGKIRTGHKKTGGRFLVRTQVFDRQLGNYIDHCRELHSKTLPGVIFKIAKNNGCQGIVIEDLKSYKVTLKQDRIQNHRLMIWAMEKKTAFLETLCDSGQMNLITKSAAYTSQTCNQCESFGFRFNFLTKKELDWYQKKGKILKNAESGYPLIGRGGDWFLCSNNHCSGKKEPENSNTKYMIQADANAAKNLLLRSFLKKGWAARLPDKEVRKEMQDELQVWLIKRYAQPENPLTRDRK